MNETPTIFLAGTIDDGHSTDWQHELIEACECYDVEFLITQEPILNDEGVDSAYTIAGTKHPDNDYISWTKN